MNESTTPEPPKPEPITQQKLPDKPRLHEFPSNDEMSAEINEIAAALAINRLCVR